MSVTTSSDGMTLEEEYRAYESIPYGHILVHKASLELISEVGKTCHLWPDGQLHFPHR